MKEGCVASSASDGGGCVINNDEEEDSWVSGCVEAGEDDAPGDDGADGVDC